MHDVQLLNVSMEHLLFVWTPVSPDCPYKHYTVISSNCGNCTNIVTSNSITCSNVVATRQLHMCTLIVQSIVCKNIPGAASNPQTIAIKGYNNIIIELLN